jgi:hypothetical protein
MNFMKRIKHFKEFLNESKKSEDFAYNKIDSLPKGSTFEDAKRIDNIFDKLMTTYCQKFFYF